MEKLMTNSPNGSDGYQCNDFLVEEQNDPVTVYFYSLIKKFIRLFSKPFPHQALISRKTLEGNWSDFKQAFPGTYRQARFIATWLDYESWWIVLGTLIVITTILFSLLYIFYSTVKCCIAPNKTKTTDRKRDYCKRHLLNILITIFVFIDVFAVSSLLISSQYAEYGADELPRRLGHCIDDLSYYKKETDQRIRNTLIDDFQELNDSLSTLIASGGEPIVQHVKKITGAHAMDSFLNISNEAQELLKLTTDHENELKIINDELLSLRSELSRLYRTSSNELYNCIHNDLEVSRKRCQEIVNELTDIDNITFHLRQDILSDETRKALNMLAESNIAEIFIAAVSDFKNGEIELNKKVQEKEQAIQTSIKEIQHDLLRIADALSTQIRQIKPELLHNLLKQYMGTNYHNIVQYTWYASLTLCAIFSLKALYFLFALCYGCFGRRPSDYRNDCCVRSTGSKLFVCGIWLAVILLPLIAALTASLLFIGANAYSLGCWPLDDPFSRPDMLSFSERLFDAWRSKQIEEDLSPLMNQLSLANVIRSCMRNETLYQIFAMDNKYHLYDLREYGKELYDHLESNIHEAFSDISLSRSIATFASPEQLTMLQQIFNITIESNIEQISQQIKDSVEQLEKIPRIISVIEDDHAIGNLPRYIQTIAEQWRTLQMKDVNRAVRNLASALKMLTELNDRLKRLTLPSVALTGKLQHAQALLSSNLNEYFRTAADQLVHEMEQQIGNYIQHVRIQMSTNVSSCVPLFNIVRRTRAALCQAFVDPFNGVWASMIISILCTIPLIVMGSAASSLYKKKHPYPKYIVNEPTNTDGQGASGTLVTDFYDARNKQRKLVYPNAYTMYFGYPPPYLRTRS
uniref:Prominin-like protein n=1 Tax=Setaria digitata TaxID=48799 RepID=A0A915PRA3_9BILA